MIKTIAVVVAMQSEFDLMSHIIDNRTEVDIDGAHAVKGDIGGRSVILMRSGIGKVNAAVRVASLIAVEHPDCVINSGVAGGIGSGIRQGDLVAGTECAYHDVWCGEGEWGQVQGLPLRFPADLPLLNTIINLNVERLHTGLICTGDQFISDPTQLDAIRLRFPDALAVDMESCAMAHVCYLRQTPFLSLRVISDTPGMEHDNTSQYFDFFRDAPRKTFAALKDMIVRL